MYGSDLVFCHCILYSTGATVISKLLLNNSVIQRLDMIGNAIGDKGACIILQSAVNNATCQAHIEIDDKYRRNIEVQTLVNIMEDRRMMKNVVGYLV